MRPEADRGILVTASELGERLSQELEVTDWRAVVAVVVAAPGLEREAEQACRNAVEAAGLGSLQVVELVVRHDESGEEQLKSINRARDVLLHDKRLVWLRAASAADVRFLRKTAPDLTSAIDLFVELRPEIEPGSDWPTCREQLRALMAERHATLDFTGLLPTTVEQRRLPLAALYQPLIDPRPLTRDPDGRTTASTGLVVLGHPGTGKTTFVRYLAWMYARREGDPLDIGDKVPLLLSLSDYGYEREHDRVVGLVDFLPRWLARQGIGHAGSLVVHLPEILLLLDGLDEIRSAYARKAVLTEVDQLVRERRVGGVVMTGRSFLADELASQKPALALASTREPTEDEARSFLTKFVELRRGTPAHAENLISRVENDDDLRALARTPLMLAFMAILDELEGRLPDRRIEIYYRLGEMLVDRWARARSIGTGPHRRERPTRADALRVLGPLAWWTVEQGGGAVAEDALSQELERIEGQREEPEHAKQRATALLELLRTDTALLVPHPGRRWSFVHSSIGEYYAGVEVERDRRRWSELLADPFRPEWREIVLFCAGQLGVIDGRMQSLEELVQAILSASHSSSRHDGSRPSLLIGLLDDSPGLNRRQIQRLIDRLLDLVLAPPARSTVAEQVQRDLVAFLTSARGPVAADLAVALRQWFSDRPREILWDRIIPDGVELRFFKDPFVDWICKDVAEAAPAILNPFVASLGDEWVRTYGIDLEPTIALWRQRDDSFYGFAEWIARSDAAARSRSTYEVLTELAQ